MEIFDELALEAAENASSGLVTEERKLGKRLSLLSFRAENPFPSKNRSRGKGNYETLLINGDILLRSALSEEISSGVSSMIKSLKAKTLKQSKVLLIGLGNPSAVVDSLGGETVKRVAAGKRGRATFFILSPSVFGLTGMESASVVRGVAREISPDLILAVDTLATRKAERLGRAVQVTDAGIIPGGGVKNSREEITQETVGAAVISVGVPLLLSAEIPGALCSPLPVCLKEIDLLVPAFASALSKGIEKAFR